jgi:murein endopeptidase
MRLAALALSVAGALAAAPGAAARLPPPDPPAAAVRPLPTQPSRAVGLPWRGRLVRGVQLPAFGPGFLTWDGPLKRVPSRDWRRWGTDRLVAVLERVAAEFATAHPGGPVLLVGDLSRPHGGVFDQRYGGLGHASHQNGLDADVFYPRSDGRPRSAWRPDQVDRPLAQELVDRFVRAGAEKVFVGPRVGLRGPRSVVQPLAHHDDHLHVRIESDPARPVARR